MRMRLFSVYEIKCFSVVWMSYYGLIEEKTKRWNNFIQQQLILQPPVWESDKETHQIRWISTWEEIKLCWKYLRLHCNIILQVSINSPTAIKMTQIWMWNYAPSTGMSSQRIQARYRPSRDCSWLLQLDWCRNPSESMWPFYWGDWVCYQPPWRKSEPEVLDFRVCFRREVWRAQYFS